MNFSPFGGHFPASLPSMHQFAAKFTNDGSGGIPPQAMPSGAMVVSGGDGIQYLRPDHSSPPAHFSNQAPIGMPTDMGKYVRRTEASPHPPTTHPLQMMNPTTKYHAGTLLGWGEMPVHHFPHAGGTGMDERSGIISAGAKAPISVPYSQGNAVVQQHHPPPTHVNTPMRPPTSSTSPWPRQQNVATMTTHHTADKCTYAESDVQPQDLCKGALRDNTNDANKGKQKDVGIHVKREKESDENKGEMDMGQSSSDSQSDNKVLSSSVATSWECLSASAQGSTVADYLSRLPASTLPLSLHHFLKYSTETVKKEQATSTATLTNPQQHQHQQQQPGTTKKKKKKKVNKEKKPRPKPGEIRISTALDGSTLFCCPECHMAYPEKEMLQQHMAGHKLERRFICDICGAGLKRKEHLDQHKRGHSQERPFVCTICLKGFKRNEHLTRHYVIHSGDKNHMCTECGKAFSRKDHLHKHVQTHIAKRVKAELSQQANAADSTTPVLS